MPGCFGCRKPIPVLDGFGFSVKVNEGLRVVTVYYCKKCFQKDKTLRKIWS